MTAETQADMPLRKRDPAFHHIFRFYGRRGRRAFILHRIAAWGLGFAILVITPEMHVAGAGDSILMVALILMGLIILSIVATAVQRLHDFGVTGWAVLLTLGFGIFFTIALAIIPGQDRENAHGPSPRGERT